MAHSSTMIFAPVFAHFILVFGLLIKLGMEKSRAVKAGEVDRAKAALDNKAWPESVVRVSNCIGNQFQLPVIFYTMTMIGFLSGQTGPSVVLLSFLFVISRYVHAYIHVSSNFVPYRFRAFLVGALILLLLTVLQAFNLIVQ